MLWRILVIPVLAFALAGAAACGDDDSSDDDDDRPTETSAPTTPGAGTPTDAPIGGPTDTPTDAPAGDPTGAPTEAPSGAATATPTAAATLDPNVISVAASDFTFTPLTIEAEAGTTVKIEFANAGAAGHTFTIDELDVNLGLNSGETGSVEFVFPNQPLEFYCSIHPLLMRGMLEPSG